MTADFGMTADESEREEMHRMNQGGGALAGMTVLDLTRVLAGPYCTMYLADMGALVVKVENPDGGDDTRSFLPAVQGVGVYFANVNRNKKGITLNLKSAEGRAMFLEMAKRADVVVENFRPGVMDRLGIGYRDLVAVNSGIIFASVSGFGSYGPYADRPGYDIVAQAMGGIMSLTGAADGGPTKIGTSIGDEAAGMNLAIGILAALLSRARTGRGQYLEVSLVDSVVSLSAIMYSDYVNGGELPNRIGNEDRGLCPFSDYRAKDGNIIVCCGNQKLFEMLCVRVLKRPELLEDPRFRDMEARSHMEHHTAFRACLEEWSLRHTVEECLDQLMAEGIPCSPIYDAGQVVIDRHIAEAREMFPRVLHPVAGDMTLMGNPIKFGDTAVAIDSPAPLLGQHNAEMYGKFLGLCEVDLAGLKASGII